MSQSLWSIRLRNSHALHHLSREYLARVCRDQSSVHSCSRTLCHAQQTSCTWLRSGCQVLGASGYVAKQVRQSNLTMHCSPVRGLQQQRRVMPFRPGMCQHGVSRMHSKLNPASSRVRCGAASPSVVLQLEAEVEDLCLATVRDALQLPGHLPPVKGLDVVLRGAPHSSLEAGAGWQAVDALQRGGWCWLASRGCQRYASCDGWKGSSGAEHAVQGQPSHSQQNTQAREVADGVQQPTQTTWHRGHVRLSGCGSGAACGHAGASAAASYPMGGAIDGPGAQPGGQRMAGDLAVEAAFAQGKLRAQVPPGADRSVCIPMRQLHPRSRRQRQSCQGSHKLPGFAVSVPDVGDLLPAEGSHFCMHDGAGGVVLHPPTLSTGDPRLRVQGSGCRDRRPASLAPGRACSRCTASASSCLPRRLWTPHPV